MNFTFGSQNSREISIYEDLGHTKIFIPQSILNYLSNSDNRSNFQNWLRQITLDCMSVSNTFILRPDMEKSTVYSLYYNLIE